MAQQTDFDFDAYTDSLVEHGLDSFRSFFEEDTYDAHDALSEAAFDVADETVGYDMDVHDAMAVLDESPNDPDEWQTFAEGKDDWREIIKAIAFTVVRQDFYDAMEDEGYLDDTWTPTEKLTGTVEA